MAVGDWTDERGACGERGLARAEGRRRRLDWGV